MFVFGKIAWLIVQPLTLALLLKIAAVVVLWFGWRKLSFVCAMLAILVMSVTLFTTTGSWALQTLEDRYPRPDLPENLGCMIVLGGAFDLEVTAGRGGMEMNQSADRFIEAARIARLRPEAKVVVSGGDGSFSGTYKGDAELAADFFAAMGVDPDRILAEKTSRNTAENVSETKALLEANGLDHCLLGLFERAGVNVVPWASDYRSSGRVRLGLDFTQPTLNSQLTSTATREWLALAVSYLRGDRDNLLP
jgi:uncharacterized SAM-binding protein YcdF (DUF218 family)